MAGWFNSLLQSFSKEETSDRASKGTIRNSWYSGQVTAGGEPSPENLNVVLNHYKLDPVVQAAISTRTNAILSSGWTIDGKPTPKASAETTLKKLGLNYAYMEQVISNALLYEHLFTEIERTGRGIPSALHTLEAPFMEIKHNEHGEIYDFVQRGEDGSEVVFPTNDIVYQKFNSVSSAVWGEVGLTSIYRTLGTKNQIEKFLNSLAMTNAWRQVFKTDMTNDNIGEFLMAYNAGNSDLMEQLVMQLHKNAETGKNDINKFEILRSPDDLKEFLGTLDYLRTQVLMLLKVPPIMIGLPDSSNRSNSDSQIKAFNMANESVRKKIADSFTNELFPKLGLSGVTFSWNPVDERSEKDDIEIAEKLMNMGAKPKMVEEFLRNAGLELPEGELFDKDIELKKSMDQYPSREGKSDGEANKQIGTGVDSTTREDQL